MLKIIKKFNNDNMKIYSKKVNDFDHYKGKHFGESWYSTIIDSDKDGYFIDPLTGKTKVLFKFRKSKIPDELADSAIGAFLKEAKKKHPNRGIATGIPIGETTARHTTESGQSITGYVASNISGYFDRPLREHRGTLGTIVACRTTAFTNNNTEQWSKGLPFVRHCSKLFKEYSPKEYRLQKREWSKIHESVKIPRTVFTTVTSNYNWQTACHRDSGDCHVGLGNLTVLGKDFNGGYLGFPEFKILIKIQPGDFLLMDSHQWHCNTPIKTKRGGFRLSFVMYIREDMHKCKTKKSIGSIKYLV